MAGAAELGERDRYYQGTIVEVHPGSRTGLLRTSGGRQVPFDALTLRIIGSAAGFVALRAGLRVGFDLGRSSRGLCVTTIRVYEAA